MGWQKELKSQIQSRKFQKLVISSEYVVDYRIEGWNWNWSIVAVGVWCLVRGGGDVDVLDSKIQGLRIDAPKSGVKFAPLLCHTSVSSSPNVNNNKLLVRSLRIYIRDQFLASTCLRLHMHLSQLGMFADWESRVRGGTNPLICTVDHVRSQNCQVSRDFLSCKLVRNSRVPS